MAQLKAGSTVGGNNILTDETTSATELGYVHGVTSAIQTQLDNKLTYKEVWSGAQPVGAVSNSFSITLNTNLTTTNPMLMIGFSYSTRDANCYTTVKVTNGYSPRISQFMGYTATSSVMVGLDMSISSVGSISFTTRTRTEIFPTSLSTNTAGDFRISRIYEII